MEHDDRDRELPLGKITVWGLLASSVVTMAFLTFCAPLSPVAFARGLVQGDLQIHVPGWHQDRVEARHRVRDAAREARHETRSALREELRSLREDWNGEVEELREEMDRGLRRELRSELRRELRSGLRLPGSSEDAPGLRWTVPSVTLRMDDDGALLPILSSELGAVLGPELGAAMGPVIGAEVARRLARAAAATNF